MIWNKYNIEVLFWGTLVSGFISSLVKWGSEVNMPPRVAGEISPPAANIDAWLGPLGFHSDSLNYIYQGTTVSGAVTAYHWLFSFAFAFIYIFISAYYPKIRLWFGAIYGLLIAIVMHGFLIPALGFRHLSYHDNAIGWLWNMNGYEFWSEVIGHIYWSFSIEISFIAVLALLAKPIRGKWAGSKE